MLGGVVREEPLSRVVAYDLLVVAVIEGGVGRIMGVRRAHLRAQSLYIRLASVGEGRGTPARKMRETVLREVGELDEDLGR